MSICFDNPSKDELRDYISEFIGACLHYPTINLLFQIDWLYRQRLVVDILDLGDKIRRIIKDYSPAGGEESTCLLLLGKP
jgi:hypothetical protein